MSRGRKSLLTLAQEDQTANGTDAYDSHPFNESVSADAILHHPAEGTQFELRVPFVRR